MTVDASATEGGMHAEALYNRSTNSDNNISSQHGDDGGGKDAHSGERSVHSDLVSNIYMLRGLDSLTYEVFDVRPLHSASEGQRGGASTLSDVGRRAQFLTPGAGVWALVHAAVAELGERGRWLVTAAPVGDAPLATEPDEVLTGQPSPAGGGRAPPSLHSALVSPATPPQLWVFGVRDERDSAALKRTLGGDLVRVSAGRWSARDVEEDSASQRRFIGQRLCCAVNEMLSRVLLQCGYIRFGGELLRNRGLNDDTADENGYEDERSSDSAEADDARPAEERRPDGAAAGADAELCALRRALHRAAAERCDSVQLCTFLDELHTAVGVRVSLKRAVDVAALPLSLLEHAHDLPVLVSPQALRGTVFARRPVGERLAQVVALRWREAGLLGASERDIADGREAAVYVDLGNDIVAPIPLRCVLVDVHAAAAATHAPTGGGAGEHRSPSVLRTRKRQRSPTHAPPPPPPTTAAAEQSAKHGREALPRAADDDPFHELYRLLGRSDAGRLGGDGRLTMDVVDSPLLSPLPSSSPLQSPCSSRTPSSPWSTHGATYVPRRRLREFDAVRAKLLATKAAPSSSTEAARTGRAAAMPAPIVERADKLDSAAAAAAKLMRTGDGEQRHKVLPTDDGGDRNVKFESAQKRRSDTEEVPAIGAAAPSAEPHTLPLWSCVRDANIAIDCISACVGLLSTLSDGRAAVDGGGSVLSSAAGGVRLKTAAEVGGLALRTATSSLLNVIHMQVLGRALDDELIPPSSSQSSLLERRPALPADEPPARPRRLSLPLGALRRGLDELGVQFRLLGAHPPPPPPPQPPPWRLHGPLRGDELLRAPLPLEPARVCVGYQGEWLESSSSILPFWEKAGLEPFGRAKAVIFGALAPLELRADASAFFDDLRCAYQEANFGSHAPLDSDALSFVGGVGADRSAPPSSAPPPPPPPPVTVDTTAESAANNEDTMATGASTARGGHDEWDGAEGVGGGGETYGSADNFCDIEAVYAAASASAAMPPGSQSAAVENDGNAVRAAEAAADAANGEGDTAADNGDGDDDLEEVAVIRRYRRALGLLAARFFSLADGDDGAHFVVYVVSPFERRHRRAIGRLLGVLASVITPESLAAGGDDAAAGADANGGTAAAAAAPKGGAAAQFLASRVPWCSSRSLFLRLLPFEALASASTRSTDKSRWPLRSQMVKSYAFGLYNMLRSKSLPLGCGDGTGERDALLHRSAPQDEFWSPVTPEQAGQAVGGGGGAHLGGGGGGGGIAGADSAGAMGTGGNDDSGGGSAPAAPPAPPAAAAPAGGGANLTALPNANISTALLYEPAVVLAGIGEPVADAAADDAAGGGGAGGVEVMLHLCYRYSPALRQYFCAWTDQRGELLDVFTVALPIPPAGASSAASSPSPPSPPHPSTPSPLPSSPSSKPSTATAAAAIAAPVACSSATAPPATAAAGGGGVLRAARRSVFTALLARGRRWWLPHMKSSSLVIAKLGATSVDERHDWDAVFGRLVALSRPMGGRVDGAASGSVSSCDGATPGGAGALQPLLSCDAHLQYARSVWPAAAPVENAERHPPSAVSGSKPPPAPAVATSPACASTAANLGEADASVRNAEGGNAEAMLAKDALASARSAAHDSGGGDAAIAAGTSGARAGGSGAGAGADEDNTVAEFAQTLRSMTLVEIGVTDDVELLAAPRGEELNGGGGGVSAAAAKSRDLVLALPGGGDNVDLARAYILRAPRSLRDSDVEDGALHMCLMRHFGSGGVADAVDVVENIARDFGQLCALSNPPCWPLEAWQSKWPLHVHMVRHGVDLAELAFGVAQRDVAAATAAGAATAPRSAAPDSTAATPATGASSAAAKI